MFDRAKPFCEGLAAISINGKWGYIDKMGYIVIDTIFDYACDFKEGLARFNIGSNSLTRGISNPKGGMWGFLNPFGRIQIIPIFDAISDFEDGYAQVIQGNNSNYIDKQGKLFLDFRN